MPQWDGVICLNVRPSVSLSLCPSVCHALLLLAPHVFLDYHGLDKIVGILLDKSWSHDAVKMTILGSATFVLGDHVLLYPRQRS